MLALRYLHHQRRPSVRMMGNEAQVEGIHGWTLNMNFISTRELCVLCVWLTYSSCYVWHCRVTSFSSSFAFSFLCLCYALGFLALFLLKTPLTVWQPLPPWFVQLWAFPWAFLSALNLHLYTSCSQVEKQHCACNGPCSIVAPLYCWSEPSCLALFFAFYFLFCSLSLLSIFKYLFMNWCRN